MLTINSIHAEPSTDKKGATTVRLVLLTKIAFVRKERVIPATAFPDETSVGKAIETVNDHILPVVRDTRIFCHSDVKLLVEKIKSINETFFTENWLGTILFKEVSALISDMFNMDFLLNTAVQ